MFDSIAFNVVISLVFIYSLYSLLVTTLNEIIASFFKLRSKTLEKGIKRMLTDNGEKVNVIVDKFYKQPLIKYLGEDNTKKPSYLSSKSFSAALVHLCNDLAAGAPDTQAQLWTGIEEIKKVNPQTGRFLETLYNDASGDIIKFKELSETWFNETMDRATGWYKKQTQRITFLVAFFVALLINVDTIGIVKNLSANPKLASEVVEMADKYQKLKNENRATAIDTATTDDINEYLNNKVKELKTNESNIQNANAILGLGWAIPKDTIHSAANSKTQKTRPSYKLVEKSNECKLSYICVEALPKSIVGLLLTTLAISLGAPFWFDLLSKLMQLRGSKKIDETPAAPAPNTQITVTTTNNPEAVG